MAAELVIAPEAAQDLDESYGWYESHRVGLGGRVPPLCGRLCARDLSVPRNVCEGLHRLPPQFGKAVSLRRLL